MHIFDPKQDYAVVDRKLPHWSQAGAITFITWRTWDSMPEHIIAEWQAERGQWLQQHGINADRADWEIQLERLGHEFIREFRQMLADRWNDRLDECHGACVLRRSELAGIVAQSLKHFDGDRYELTDFVVMPNHVHLLAAFPSEKAMLEQCESWKHFTATKINRILRRSGRFWQADAFDHLVRSAEQFEALRRYIADNPVKAKLKPGEFIMYSSRSA